MEGVRVKGLGMDSFLTENPHETKKKIRIINETSSQVIHIVESISFLYF